MTTRLPAGTTSGSAVDVFLSEARDAAVAGRAGGRLIFALDATGSRQPTWSLARELQAGMFDAAATAGGLAVQLVYFRGAAECRASRWFADARALRHVMGRIECRSGGTQIGRVLTHARGEVSRGPVRALVYVGDAVEEPVDALCAQAGELRLLGLKAFMFHEGGDPIAAEAFRTVAGLTGGAAFAFDGRAPASLAALLRAVAAYAGGGGAALRALAAREPDARRLLAAMST